MALRAVGIGLSAVAWASVLGSEAQQSADVRAYLQVGAAVLSVCVVQWLTALPPSANVVDVLRLFQRDILAVADRKSTRLNSSHVSISYAVFCLKKKINCT